jgi:hypothetical protein
VIYRHRPAEAEIFSDARAQHMGYQDGHAGRLSNRVFALAVFEQNKDSSHGSKE